MPARLARPPLPQSDGLPLVPVPAAAGALRGSPRPAPSSPGGTAVTRAAQVSLGASGLCAAWGVSRVLSHVPLASLLCLRWGCRPTSCLVNFGPSAFGPVLPSGTSAVRPLFRRKPHRGHRCAGFSSPADRLRSLSGESWSLEGPRPPGFPMAAWLPFQRPFVLRETAGVSLGGSPPARKGERWVFLRVSQQKSGVMACGPGGSVAKGQPLWAFCTFCAGEDSRRLSGWDASSA